MVAKVVAIDQMTVEMPVKVSPGQKSLRFKVFNSSAWSSFCPDNSGNIFLLIT